MERRKVWSFRLPLRTERFSADCPWKRGCTEFLLNGGAVLGLCLASVPKITVGFYGLAPGAALFDNRFYPARHLFFIKNFFACPPAGRVLFFNRLDPAGLLLSLPPKNRAAYREQRPLAGYAEAARGRLQVKVDKEPTQQPSAIELARMAEAPGGRRSQSASSRFRLVGSPRVLRGSLKAKHDASGNVFTLGEKRFGSDLPMSGRSLPQRRPAISLRSLRSPQAATRGIQVKLRFAEPGGPTPPRTEARCRSAHEPGWNYPKRPRWLRPERK